MHPKAARYRKVLGEMVQLRALLFLLVGLAVAMPTYAHLPEVMVRWNEISDEDIEKIDLKDGSIADWPTSYSGKTEFLSLTKEGYPYFSSVHYIGEGHGGDPEDLDFEIYLGWNQTHNRIYIAMVRTDDVYLNEYRGANTPDSIWLHDSSVWFMIDPTHSGEPYGFGKDCCNPTAQTAQLYHAIAETPDGMHLQFNGPEVEWLNSPKYMDGGGGRDGNKTVVEFYITPFNSLDVESESNSMIAQLEHAMVMGFSFAVGDFDTEPGQYDSLLNLSWVWDANDLWWRSDVFIDARLISNRSLTNECGVLFDCSPPDEDASADSTSTAVPSASWSRIKETFND